MRNELKCPVCGNDTLELGEMIDVGFGASNGVKGGPDRCHTCGYIEQGPDPTDLPMEHYVRCWKDGVDPRPPIVEPKMRQMSPGYERWILVNVKDRGYGNCFEMSLAMRKVFPELQMVRGTYYCFVWGERDHYWLIDSEGFIVDPTFMQFPSRGGLYQGSLMTDEQIWLLTTPEHRDGVGAK